MHVTKLQTTCSLDSLATSSSVSSVNGTRLRGECIVVPYSTAQVRDRTAAAQLLLLTGKRADALLGAAAGSVSSKASAEVPPKLPLCPSALEQANKRLTFEQPVMSRRRRFGRCASSASPLSAILGHRTTARLVSPESELSADTPLLVIAPQSASTRLRRLVSAARLEIA